MTGDEHTVGAVAGLAGVSVRTLPEFLAATRRAGPAGDPRALDLAERHRQHIDRLDGRRHSTLQRRG